MSQESQKVPGNRIIKIIESSSLMNELSTSPSEFFWCGANSELFLGFLLEMLALYIQGSVITQLINERIMNFISFFW